MRSGSGQSRPFDFRRESTVAPKAADFAMTRGAKRRHRTKTDLAYLTWMHRKRLNDLAPPNRGSSNSTHIHLHLTCRWRSRPTQIDKTAWPAPVVRLFLGELDLAQTLAAADDEDPATKQRQVCDTNFYSGELALLTGAKDGAINLVQLAAQGCLRSWITWDDANAELKTLGAAR
jgi:hypothetical protein